MNTTDSETAHSFTVQMTCPCVILSLVFEMI